MATQKDKDSGGFSSSVLDFIKTGVFDLVRDSSKKLVHTAQRVIYQTQEKIVQQLIAALLFFLGMVFVLIAVVRLLSQYVGLSDGWSFLIVGLLILIIALTQRKKYSDDRYYKF
ncbi:MAG: hypothetical protein ABIC95_02035 [archaeon]